MKLKIAVLDDENHALERFASVAENFEEIVHCELFGDSEDLLAHLEQNQIDMAFLDIEMPGRSGIDLAEEIGRDYPDTSVVFVTAFSQYAVEAFEQNAVDYLLKPVSRERLSKTLDRIRNSGKYSAPEEARLEIQCFQRFECRRGDTVLPVNKLMKTKELLAFLVSRKGAETSWEQITEALWPDADYEKAHNNLHVTTYRLRKWLAENHAGQIFEAKRNSYRVVPSEFFCDLYEMEKAFGAGDIRKIRLLWKGDFLEEEAYEWAYPIQAEWSIKWNDLRKK